MVDSRQKGARAEHVVKELLKQATDLNWQRVPASGALSAEHGLKGDLYLPSCNNMFCIEVKHYKDDKLTSKVLTDNKPQISEWWNQAKRQGEQVNKEPLLFFKFDRSKIFVATKRKPKHVTKYMYIKFLDIYTLLAEEWLLNEDVEFTQ